MLRNIFLVTFLFYSFNLFSQADCGIFIVYKGNIIDNKSSVAKVKITLKNKNKAYYLDEEFILYNKSNQYFGSKLSSEYCDNFDIKHFFLKWKLYKIEVFEFRNNQIQKTHEVDIPIEEISFKFSENTVTIIPPEIKL